MLVSGVVAGIAAGIAFGGEWRRLNTFTLLLWPLLVIGAGLRLFGELVPTSPLAVYFIGLICIAVVAARNWRLPGAALISVGTFSNVLVVLLNNGMPYDVAVATEINALPPNNGLYVALGPDTIFPFLADIIPVAFVPVGFLHSVYSVGDFLIAFGGFLIPFLWLQASPEEVAGRHELRSTNFALFWIAQVISRFGDPITLIALTFVTYRATGSALWTALAVVIATIPNALFSLFGGAIADALGARRAMLWCDVLRVAFIAAVPVLIEAGAPLAVVFFLVFLAGICGAIFNPARVAIVPALLTPDRLPAANSLVYGSDRAVEIGGALAAGVLVATFGTGAFYADALSVRRGPRQRDLPALHRWVPEGTSAHRWLRDLGHRRGTHRCRAQLHDRTGSVRAARCVERALLRADSHDPAGSDTLECARPRLRRAHRPHEPELVTPGADQRSARRRHRRERPHRGRRNGHSRYSGGGLLRASDPRRALTGGSRTPT